MGVHRNVHRNNKKLSPIVLAGEKLNRLKGKIPVDKDWRRKNFIPQLLEWLNQNPSHNLGWVIFKGSIVIDVDNKDFQKK